MIWVSSVKKTENAGPTYENGTGDNEAFKKIKLLNLLSADLNEVDYDLAYLEL